MQSIPLDENWQTQHLRLLNTLAVEGNLIRPVCVKHRSLNYCTSCGKAPDEVWNKCIILEKMLFHYK